MRPWNRSNAYSAVHNPHVFATFHENRTIGTNERDTLGHYDELLAAVMPMLATTQGRFIALSTPKGRRGWFYKTWIEGGDAWQRVSVPATACPRISPEFLEEQQRILGTTVFEQEYCCVFHDDGDSAFNSALIEAALTLEFEPFFLGVS
jgi:hypothetical protein